MFASASTDGCSPFVRARRCGSCKLPNVCVSDDGPYRSSDPTSSTSTAWVISLTLSGVSSVLPERMRFCPPPSSTNAQQQRSCFTRKSTPTGSTRILNTLWLTLAGDLALPVMRSAALRASMVAASHQNPPVTRAESENGVYECRSDVNGEREDWSRGRPAICITQSPRPVPSP